MASLSQFLLLSTVNNNAADLLGLGDYQVTYAERGMLGAHWRVFRCLSQDPGDWNWETLHVFLEAGRQHLQ